MIEQGVHSVEMMQRGLVKARAKGSQWIPSPGEFCAWCKPCAEDYGLPSSELAFIEARNESAKAAEFRKWSHEVVRLAAGATGYHDLKTLIDTSARYREIKKMFCEQYDALVHRVMNGETFTVPASHRIEHVEPDYSDPKHNAEGEKVMGRLMGMFNEL